MSASTRTVATTHDRGEQLNMGARTTGLVLSVLLLAACHPTAKPDPHPRPDWAGGSIDGIAPLMTPAAVQSALDRAHYRQVKCTADKPLLVDPVNQGDDMACFAAPGHPMIVSLYFLELKEGRRLAVAFFNESVTSARSDAERLAHSRAFAQTLLARFGKPMVTRGADRFQMLYWMRPGGATDLPDMIETTVGADFGANATLTSMWAYGQERPKN